MRLTIIPIDSTVIVDGIIKHQPLDISGCGIPTDIHALQWYENRGWIEYSDNIDPFICKKANEDIYSLPDWANACVEVWTNWQSFVATTETITG